MKKPLLAAALAVLAFSATAQNTPIGKSNYELASRFSPEKVDKMVFSTSVLPVYLKSGNKFWYKYETTKGTTWYLVDGLKGTKTPLFDNAKMAARVTEIVQDPFDSEHLPIDSIRFSSDERSFTFQVKSSVKEDKPDPDQPGKTKKENKVVYMSCDLASESVTKLLDSPNPKKYPSWASVSPDGNTVVFTRNYNLYYMDRSNFEKAIKDDKDSTMIEHAITTDGEEFYAWGSSSDQFNNENKDKKAKERRDAGVLWSPDSKHFVMERSDYREVGSLWVIRSTDNPRPTLESYKYHLPGEANAPKTALYLFDTATKKHKVINASAYKDQDYIIHSAPKLKANREELHQPSIWMGTSDNFFITRTSRDLKRIDLCQVSVSDQSVKPIFEDRLNKSLETRAPYYIDQTSELVCWSERDGWGHLYLYSKDGELKNRITRGAFHVESVVGVNPSTRTIYFTGNGYSKDEHPYYTHLFKVNFDGSGLRQLTEAGFDHQVNLSDNNNYFVDNFSRVDTAPVSALLSTNGATLSTLEITNLGPLMAAGYKFPEIFKAKAADGITDLYGVLYKPFDFDSTKLYPIIEYVYPGPQTEAVNYSFSKKMDRIDRLSQLGFIVVTVGNRGGHPSRSKWYHTYGYNDLRDYGLADKKYVAEQLAAARPYMDISKVGIHGHSGGGFMSTAALLSYPNFFKVAVSCAGNHENNIYNRWWSEKHHGVEEVITEKGDTTFVYDIEKNSELAARLSGKLLLITGDIDNNVHPANTIRVANALIKAGKRFDMLILPGQRHGFGDMTEYFFWRMADYFSEHLIGSSNNGPDITQMQK